MSKPKACPFCGKKKDVHIDKQLTERQLRAIPRLTQEYAVGCWACRIQGARADTTEECIEQWNNRPLEDALQKRIAELEKDKLKSPHEVDDAGFEVESKE